MTDLNYILETVLLLAAPFIPVTAGLLLRRKFASAEGAPRTGLQKAGRLTGNILLWGGVLGILFMILLLFHFNGKL